jgi:hypothetical protein
MASRQEAAIVERGLQFLKGSRRRNALSQIFTTSALARRATTEVSNQAVEIVLLCREKATFQPRSSSPKTLSHVSLAFDKIRKGNDENPKRRRCNAVTLFAAFSIRPSSA